MENLGIKMDMNTVLIVAVVLFAIWWLSSNYKCEYAPEQFQEVAYDYQPVIATSSTFQGINYGPHFSFGKSTNFMFVNAPPFANNTDVYTVVYPARNDRHFLGISSSSVNRVAPTPVNMVSSESNLRRVGMGYLATVNKYTKTYNIDPVTKQPVIVQTTSGPVRYNGPTKQLVGKILYEALSFTYLKGPRVPPTTANFAIINV